ncbi:MAG: tetratricopeptide repeat protein [Pseudomonadota bacterium]
MTTLVYLNTLDNPFVFDDHQTVLENPSLKDISNFLFVLVFERFRPAVNITYALDYLLWGENPLGFHITNLVLHIANTLLVFFLMIGLFRDKSKTVVRTSDATSEQENMDIPLLVAGVFALHPMMTEAVGYVSGRAEVLCGVFFFAAFICVRRGLIFGKKHFWVLGLLFWLLSVASKEVGAMLPFLVLVYDMLLLDRQGTKRRIFRLYLPLALVLLVGFILRIGSYVQIESSMGFAHVWNNFLTQLIVFWQYLGLLILPVNQSIVHSIQEVRGFLNIGVVMSSVGIAGMVSFAWWLRERCPLCTLGIAWFVLLLIPSMLLPLTELMAEHRVYLASGGLVLAVGTGLERSLRKYSKSFPRIIGVGVLLLLALTSYTRNKVWDSPVSLWEDAASKSPNVYAPHYQLGNSLRISGQCDNAVHAYKKAIQLMPKEMNAWNNLGICLAQLGRFPEAREVFLRVVDIAPSYVKAHNNLGLLNRQLGKLDEARKYFEKALHLDPQNRLALEQLRQLSP